MNYTNNRGIPYAAIIGENEINTQTIMLKNMVSGEQQAVTIEELINLIKGA